MGFQSKPQLLLSRVEIEAAVKRLADEIDRDYRDKYPLLIAVLKGSFMFMADLVRLLDFPLEVEFVGISSYGRGRETSGEIKIVQRPRCPVRGRHVLVVEDIVDTGLTIAFFMDYLCKKKPSSLRLCALADKPSRRRTDVAIDYLGFTVPDKFIVGYGLDWDEEYRNLPDICVLEDES